jgi:pyrroloquinoline-quinone synthase
VSGEGGLLTADAFVARLREEGTRRYHDQHPFHQLMHAGQLTRE